MPLSEGHYIFALEKLLDELAAPLVTHVARGNDDDVDNPPHAQSTTGDELEDSSAPLANEHAVNAEGSHKDGQNQGESPVAGCCCCFVCHG